MKTLKVSDFFQSEHHAFSLFDMNCQSMEDVHEHEFDELVIVRNGSGFHIINDQAEFIHKGDFFIVSAHDVHCYESTNNLSITNILLHTERPFHFISNIGVLTAGIKDYTASMKKRRAGLTDEELAKVIELTDKITRRCDARYDNTYFATAESYLLSMIVMLYQCATRREYRISPTDSGKRHLLNYLRENYTCSINWNYLCEESGVAKRTMFRFVKEITGYTPEKFQQRYRLLKTQELLRTSDLTIGKIATLCGFSTTSRLTEAYKKQFNRTPTQERMRVSNSVIATPKGL
ncbi:helix-turn-helix domain-containing protein [Rahnella woolbedingensis]|uniref:Helix-turn-helix domain-containing protein n=1 Tax=Rahnella woolbedingensis TaxID=1510574 RepID=A0A419N990_9GAMM|nr:helix-turn-helix domain-containing protein [Rahnella woolbedingensis]RJT44083.1 helix-turn-helix domain-containing protein [Rahnella woolbedingensis]